MQEPKATKTKKKSKFRKILKYLFILVVVLELLFLAPAFFYRPEKNANPLPPYYKKGVYHMHSVFSDGTGTVDDITGAAAALNLDFVILTDHGRPNINSSMSTSWRGNVLLIGGTELSLNCGHLAAAGYKIPDYIFPPEPQEAIDEITGDGGVCFVSHPFDHKVPWTDWDIRGFTGLEVFSSYSEAMKAGILKMLGFPLRYAINSKYALLNTLGFPVKNIKKWDALNDGGAYRYYGIYALDAHAKLKITEKTRLHFPSYRSMFEIMTVYVKIKGELEKDAGAAMSVVSSLREGNFFNALEGIAPANGFEAFFMEEETGKRVEMGGDSHMNKGKLVLRLPFEFAVDVRVLRNGKEYKKIAGNREEQLEIAVKEPGVYRVEVYVPGNTFDELPWIMTNPFFIGVGEAAPLPAVLPGKEEVILKRPLPDAQESFNVEKNQRSEGEVSYETDRTDKAKITAFTFKLAQDSPTARDFWSVLSLRKRFDFSGYKGFVFEVRSDKKRRFWMEFRTTSGSKDDETWYRHSFLADSEWRTIVIPFNKFHGYFGENRGRRPALNMVSSVFVSINNGCAFPGTYGTLYLKHFGLF